MRKILYAASNPVHLRNFHAPYIDRLAAEGDQVWTLCSGGYERPGVFRSIDLPLRKSMWAPVNFISALRLAALLRRERFDLLCVHTSLAAFFVRLALLLAGKGETKAVNVVHGYLFDECTPLPKRLPLLLAELLLRRVTDRVVVMNEGDRKLAEKHRLGAEVVFVPGAGVDFGRIGAADRGEARRKLGLREDALLLLYPAEFSKRKNQAFLIRAMALLPENVLLALPGEGSCLASCRRLAEKLALSGRLRFPGYTADLSEWYAAADICVSAARHEGLPFNVMEGMYAMKPVVASRVAGHTDLVTDGVGGFLYGFGDAEEYADCVRTLSKDPELRQIMGEKNRKLAAAYARERVEDIFLAAETLEELPIPAHG